MAVSARSLARNALVALERGRSERLRSELEAKCLSIHFDGDFAARGWRGVISLDAGEDVDIFNQLVTDKGGGRITALQSELN